MKKTYENVLVNIGTKQMPNSNEILGTKIDSKHGLLNIQWVVFLVGHNSKLNFKDHIGIICTKSQCQIKWFEHSARLNES